MKQFMLLKVLFVPVFFIAVFPALAMKKMKKDYENKLLLLHSGFDSKSYSLQKEDSKKWLSSDVGQESTTKANEFIQKLIESDKKKYNLSEVEEFKKQFKNQNSFSLRSLLTHSILINKSFFCGDTPVPGPVLEILVEELIVSDPSLVNKTIDWCHFKPLEFLARYGNKGRYFYCDEKKETVVSLYPKSHKDFILQRTQKMVELFLKHGAKMTSNMHKIAKNLYMLKCASKEYRDFFDPIKTN